MRTLALSVLALALLPAAADAADATLTRIEPHNFYGASVTKEAGVYVYRVLPATSAVIINPDHKTPLNLSINQGGDGAYRTGDASGLAARGGDQAGYGVGGQQTYGGYGGFGDYGGKPVDRNFGGYSGFLGSGASGGYGGSAGFNTYSSSGVRLIKPGSFGGRDTGVRRFQPVGATFARPTFGGFGGRAKPVHGVGKVMVRRHGRGK